ncbi:MAG: TatD family hydrolase [Patescibacteria group bacterium]|nr:TatD family hydrolase [Patescibacteria group bacterium]
MLIDTHSHLHFKKYDEDREAVHERMAEFDIKTITVGTAINTSRDGVAYADEHPDTWAAVGYHPDHVTSDFEDEDEIGASKEPYDIKELENIAKSSKRVIAIGEIGLDYHYFTQEGTMKPGLTIEQAKKEQQKVFLEQAALASKLNKTLIVHARDSVDDMMRITAELRRTDPNLRIVIHGFTETWQTAQTYLDLGCYLGIGGIVTFKPRKTTAPEDTLESIVKKMPLDRLLLETDAPWLAPVPVRGSRNEPAYVRHIAEHVARAKGMEYEEICKVTTKNSQEAFACEF